MNYYLVKNYYPPPPIISSQLVYQNVNNNKDLRKDVTIFFVNKCVEWLSKDSEFSHEKKNINKLKSSTGKKLIYNLIKNFINKYDLNWYDLRTHNYHLIKKFFKRELEFI